MAPPLVRRSRAGIGSLSALFRNSTSSPSNQPNTSANIIVEATINGRQSRMTVQELVDHLQEFEIQTVPNLRNQLQRAERSLRTSEHERRTLVLSHQQLNTKLSKVETERDEIRKHLAQFQDRLNQTDIEVESQKAELSTVKEEFDKLTNDHTKLKEDYKRDVNVDFKDLLQKEQLKHSVTIEQLDKITCLKDVSVCEAAVHKERIQAIHGQLNAKDEEIDSILKVHNSQLNRLFEDKCQTEKSHEALKNDLQELSSEIVTLKSQLSKFEVERENLLQQVADESFKNTESTIALQNLTANIAKEKEKESAEEGERLATVQRLESDLQKEIAKNNVTMNIVRGLEEELENEKLMKVVKPFPYAAPSRPTIPINTVQSVSVQTYNTMSSPGPVSPTLFDSRYHCSKTRRIDDVFTNRMNLIAGKKKRAEELTAFSMMTKDGKRRNNASYRKVLPAINKKIEENSLKDKNENETFMSHKEAHKELQKRDLTVGLSLTSEVEGTLPSQSIRGSSRLDRIEDDEHPIEASSLLRKDSNVTVANNYAVAVAEPRLLDDLMKNKDDTDVIVFAEPDLGALTTDAVEEPNISSELTGSATPLQVLELEVKPQMIQQSQNTNFLDDSFGDVMEILSEIAGNETESLNEPEEHADKNVSPNGARMEFEMDDVEANDSTHNNVIGEKPVLIKNEEIRELSIEDTHRRVSRFGRIIKVRRTISPDCSPCKPSKGVDVPNLSLILPAHRIPKVEKLEHAGIADGSSIKVGSSRVKKEYDEVDESQPNVSEVRVKKEHAEKTTDVNDEIMSHYKSFKPVKSAKRAHAVTYVASSQPNVPLLELAPRDITLTANRSGLLTQSCGAMKVVELRVGAPPKRPKMEVVSQEMD